MKSIILLESSFANRKGDLIELVQETDGEIYYYDEFERYVYMLKSERGILWEWKATESENR